MSGSAALMAPSSSVATVRSQGKKLVGKCSPCAAEQLAGRDTLSGERGLILAGEHGDVAAAGTPRLQNHRSIIHAPGEDHARGIFLERLVVEIVSQSDKVRPWIIVSLIRDRSDVLILASTGVGVDRVMTSQVVGGQASMQLVVQLKAVVEAGIVRGTGVRRADRG